MTDGLHFAGHLTIDAVFRSLSATTSLNSSSAFVAFAGGSAGAVGVFNNCDYVASIVKGTVTCVPIGGYVPEIVWYPGAHSHTPAEDLRDDAFESHVQLFGARLPPACVASLGPTSSYKCILPRISYPFIDRPVFIIEAITDSCVLCEFEGMGKSVDTCGLPPRLHALWPPSAKAFAAAYGANATANFRPVLASARDGLFAASCFLHCGFELARPMINGTGVVNALSQWVSAHMAPTPGAFDDPYRYKWMDTCSRSGRFWPPCNPTCPLVPRFDVLSPTF